MIRLVVLCEYFPPENKIGSIRPSKIVKYLGRRDDVETTVICAKPKGMDCGERERLYERVEVLRLSRSRLASLLRRKRPAEQSAAEQQLPARKQNVKQILIAALLRFRDGLEQEVLYSRAKKALRGKHFDVMLSTFNTELGHRVALWYKKRNPNTTWIADFRDPTWAQGMSSGRKKKMIALAQKTADHCDAITAVTKGILDVHKKDFGDTPCYVIPNGYDLSDRERELPLQDGIFRLVYTGELYDGKRDLTPVFRALTQAAENGKVDLSRVVVIYAGQGSSAFLRQAARYPQVPVSNRGFISREEALKLQDQAHVLLLSSWCGPNDKDTLTGKFFEYLSADKPIVCTISGDEGQSALSEAIRTHGLGVCYEQANETEDFPALCSYLEEQYACFVQEGRLCFQPDTGYIQQFSYEKIAQQFYTLIKEGTEGGRL